MTKFHYGDSEARLNLAEILENGARRWPENLATICLDNRLTYRELEAAANRSANVLASLGITAGDRVAVMLPNVPEFPIVYYAILKLGATVVPVNTLFRELEIRYILEDSAARAIVAWRPVAAEARKAVIGSSVCQHCILAGDDEVATPLGSRERKLAGGSTAELSLEAMSEAASGEFVAYPTRETDTAVILYTSGTTGRSKGAELTHFNLQRNAATVARMIDITERDRFVATLPLFHSFGQTHVLNATFLHGGAIIIHPRFDAAKVLGSFTHGGATLFAGVPTMYVYLLNASGAAVETRHVASLQPVLTTLRLCISGGAPMPVSVLQEFEERFGVAILEGYGLSETSPVACSNRPDRRRKAGSIGLPVDEAEVRVVDDDDRELPAGQVGELLIRGPLIMKGYLNKPEATAEAMRGGWFHSGDLARRDDDGYVYIVDRKKDMILKSGYNIYPREVEEVLYRHPAVAEAAVVGVPDPAKGEDVKAFVVLREGCVASAEEIAGHCRELIAPYKCPRYVEFIAALPKSATGKILRRELRDLAGR